MKFVCEYCHQQFDDPDLAVECEKAHKEEEEQKKRDIAERESYESTISDAYNAFIAKYKEAPVITLTKENEKILMQLFSMPRMSRLLGFDF